MKKALFSKRVFAYIIDILLVAIISAMLSMPFVNTDLNKELRAEVNEAAEKYVNKEIDLKTYYSQVVDLNYETVRSEGAVSLISLFITILYFIVFQFYNKGQTLGKKLMKIRISNTKGDKLTLNNVILRSLIINSIIFDMILLFVAFIGNKNAYGYSNLILEILQYIIIIATIIMVIVRKDGRGLHDFLGNTMVVEDARR